MNTSLLGKLAAVALSVLPLAGCGSAVDAGDVNSEQAALSIPTQTFNFSQSLHFCETVDLGVTHVTVCTPHIGFSGALSVGDYTTYPDTDLPKAMTANLHFSSPIGFTSTLAVGIAGSGICQGLGDYVGVSLDVCMKSVDYVADTSKHTLSFKLKVSINGSAGVDGVGISDTVSLYTTPTITLPY